MKNKTNGYDNGLLTLSEWTIRVGQLSARLGMALVIGWIGAMKFTSYEAHGISGFVENSPLLSWFYKVVSIQQFSNALGVIELSIAAGMLLGLAFPRIAIASALAACAMFATTLSFMVTTPGTFEQSLGFPALSVVPGQFLIKDAATLGLSVLLLGESLKQYVLSTRVCLPHNKTAPPISFQETLA